VEASAIGSRTNYETNPHLGTTDISPPFKADAVNVVRFGLERRQIARDTKRTPQRGYVSQESSLTQSAHSVRQVLTAYKCHHVGAERKLDRMLDELRTPTAIGYSARRGNRPRND
jgi:hypothetical protein